MRLHIGWKYARIFTSAVGGGDERIFMMSLAGDAMTPMTARLLGLAMVLLFCLPPIVIAYRAIDNRWRAAYIAGFCILPLFVVMAYKFKLLNGMLRDGVLATPVVIGTPALVLVVFAAMIAITVACWGSIRRLSSP